MELVGTFCLQPCDVLEPHYVRFCGIKVVVILGVNVVWIYSKQLSKGLILLPEAGQACAL